MVLMAGCPRFHRLGWVTFTFTLGHIRNTEEVIVHSCAEAGPRSVRLPAVVSCGAFPVAGKVPDLAMYLLYLSVPH